MPALCIGNCTLQAACCKHAQRPQLCYGLWGVALVSCRCHTCQLREAKVHGLLQQFIDEHKVALDAVFIQRALKVGAEQVNKLRVRRQGEGKGGDGRAAWRAGFVVTRCCVFRVQGCMRRLRASLLPLRALPRRLPSDTCCVLGCTPAAWRMQALPGCKQNTCLPACICAALHTQHALGV